MPLLLLGSPTLQTDDGHPIAFDTRKALALLAYLALHDQPFQRDTLAALFWPELDQSRARAALRRTLAPLNKALGENALLASRDVIEINPEYSLWVDARGFEVSIHAAQNHAHAENETCETCFQSLMTAAHLYKGDFMAGFTLRDAPEFDDWQFFEADRLRRLYATALERLIPLQTARGELDPAIEHTRKWLTLDPLHEPAHRALMRLYAQTNQRAAALRQYRECVRILDEELGVPPLEETKQLYEEILENRVLVDRLIGDRLTGEPVTSQPVTSQPINQLTSQPIPTPPLIISNYPLTINNYFPLTSRATEWNTLLTAYTRPTPDGFFIGIEGEAGVGKTRLAEEFLAYAQSLGAVALTARCYRGEEQLAYSPFVEGIRGILSRPDAAARLAHVPAHWLTETARLLPEISNPSTSNLQLPLRTGLQSPITNDQLPITPSQTRLFESLRQVILALSAGRNQGVLLMDDLQWADSASLDLLIYLVRRLQDYPLLVIASWRNEGDLTRLDGLLTECQRAGMGSKIELNRFTRADVETLATKEVFSSESLQTLFNETEGLPFFVVEYLSAARQGNDWTTLRSVQDLERARLTGLNEIARQVLAAAAVMGRSFEFDTLREVSGRSEEETITGLETLVSRGLLLERSKDEGRNPSFIPHPSAFILPYDFTHEKIRSVVYEDTSLARRRLLHRRVAQSLISQSRISPSPALIARHLHLAGQEAEAAVYYQQAGEHARSLYANTESLSHFQTALALGHPEPAMLHEAIGDLQTLRGDYRTAITSYETAALLADPGTLPELERKLGNLHHRRGNYDLAISYFQSALNGLEENKASRARILTDWSRTCASQNDLARAVQLAEEALTLSDSPLLMGEGGVEDNGVEDNGVENNSGVRAQAHNVLGMIARQTGDLARAADHLQQALKIADTEGHLPAHIAALNNLALVYEDQSDYPRAVELAQTALDLCTRLGDRHREAALRNRLADLFHASDQPSAAMYHLKKAVEIFSEIGGAAAVGTRGEHEPEIWKLTEW